YQYSAVDHSLVSRYILKPFYTNFFIHLFPLSMAYITLSGFAFMIVNLRTLLWYNPTLDRDCPGWVYALWAVVLFLYQTFDACDGTQARRTRQSGPSGELFDHDSSVDAFNTTLEVVIFAGAMNLGYSWITILTLFASLCAFYLTTWEEYHTGTLYLGLVSGPVEGVLTLCAVYAVTTFKAGSFWQRPMPEALGLPSPGFLAPVLRDMSFTQWYLVYGGIILAFNIVQSSHNVTRARRSKNLPVAPALLGLASFFTTWLAIPLRLSLCLEILHEHILPFIFFIGASFAYQVGLIITAHLTKSPFPYFNVLSRPILAVTLDSLRPFLQARLGLGWPSVLGGGPYTIAYVFACLGLRIGVYGSFVVDVVANICDYLNICCLSITHPYAPNAPLNKVE
ncbi:hypothetical protein HOY82DRAFT_483162, partial [Tuber indicum]